MPDRPRDEYGRFRARTYRVTVWNITNGDIVHYAPEATETELRQIERDFDDPFYSLEIEDNP